MGTTKVDCELQLFKLGGRLSGELAAMPTVCLLAADALSPSLDLSALVDRLVPAGCRYFMTWGAAAEELHDALDEVLEDRGGDSLAAVTASHKGEPAEDVAWFMANAAVPGESRLRCCVGYDDAVAGMDELLKAVRAVVPGTR
jgi:hypothetical protein